MIPPHLLFNGAEAAGWIDFSVVNREISDGEFAELIHCSPAESFMETTPSILKSEYAAVR